jgi:iron(III) transport system substrate-binding protein
VEMRGTYGRICLYAVTAIGVSFTGCGRTSPQPKQQVVVYTSLDKIFSEPVLRVFEKETGIKVLEVYDSEATKTTGLANRLIAEKDRPRADVFWNSETGRTIVLKRRGVLASYVSPSAADIPVQFKDPQGYWTGFAARCRVLIYNKQMVKADEVPRSIFELTGPRWKGRIALAYPLFGTTATHCAAWFASLGEEKAKAYLEALKANEVMVTDGNASSRDRVADGTVALGFTDTDDAYVAMGQGHPVDLLWPDQEGLGTLLIPNTVALIRGGPNPEAGRQLIDFLLSSRVEEMLAQAESGQIPLRPTVNRPSHVPRLDQIKVMNADYEKIADWMEPSGQFLQRLFVR